MTVVEAYLGGEKMDTYDNASTMCTSVTALLIEGIAQNTTGTVFMPEVITP
jgi:P-type Ca2+ transporter type 2C